MSLQFNYNVGKQPGVTANNHKYELISILMNGQDPSLISLPVEGGNISLSFRCTVKDYYNDTFIEGSTHTETVSWTELVNNRADISGNIYSFAPGGTGNPSASDLNNNVLKNSSIDPINSNTIEYPINYKTTNVSYSTSPTEDRNYLSITFNGVNYEFQLAQAANQARYYDDEYFLFNNEYRIPNSVNKDIKGNLGSYTIFNYLYEKNITRWDWHEYRVAEFSVGNSFRAETGIQEDLEDQFMLSFKDLIYTIGLGNGVGYDIYFIISSSGIALYGVRNAPPGSGNPTTSKFNYKGECTIEFHGISGGTSVVRQDVAFEGTCDILDI